MTKQVTPTYRKPVQRTGHEAGRVMRTVCAQAHQGPRRSHSLRQRPDIWQQPDIDMGILRPCKWGGDHICAEERSAPSGWLVIGALPASAHPMVGSILFGVLATRGHPFSIGGPEERSAPSG